MSSKSLEQLRLADLYIEKRLSPEEEESLLRHLQNDKAFCEFFKKNVAMDACLKLADLAIANDSPRQAQVRLDDRTLDELACLSRQEPNILTREEPCCVGIDRALSANGRKDQADANVSDTAVSAPLVPDTAAVSPIPARRRRKSVMLLIAGGSSLASLWLGLALFHFVVSMTGTYFYPEHPYVLALDDALTSDLEVKENTSLLSEEISLIFNEMRLSLTWPLKYFTGAACEAAVPDGMPKLYDFDMVVLQNGTPLEGAQVTLRCSAHPYLVTGVTDKKGVAQLMTEGRYDGAPAGEYKVSVVKQVVSESKYGSTAPINAKKRREWDENRRRESRTVHSYVNAKYRDFQTTDIEIQIADPGSARLDVGGPVNDVFLLPDKNAKMDEMEAAVSPPLCMTVRPAI